MVKDAGIPKKPKNYTVGPGLVGHMWNDWPYLCLFIYPWLLGILVNYRSLIPGQGREVVPGSFMR